MALVDYSSSDGDDDSDAPDHHAAQEQQQQQPPAKRQRTNPPSPSAIKQPATPTTALPPLPAAFHNLYATTTRPAPTDLPSLHQGRRRTTPHIAGTWPSHIAIDWHPPERTHATLTALLDALAQVLPPDQPLTSFLTSDLHAPLPLHVSLSRPFALRTAEKAGFLEEAMLAIATAVAGPFELGPTADDALAWFRSKEGGRSFLVLKVQSRSSSSSAAAALGQGPKNPELAALLARCNALVGAYGQPKLYARLGGVDVAENGDGKEGKVEGDSDGGGVQPVDDGDGVDGAFHVSIAWSFAEPTPEIRARTAAVFAREEFQRETVDGVRIPVGDVKVKIGNVVTSVPLGGRAGLER